MQGFAVHKKILNVSEVYFLLFCFLLFYILSGLFNSTIDKYEIRLHDSKWKKHTVFSNFRNQKKDQSYAVIVHNSDFLVFKD